MKKIMIVILLILGLTLTTTKAYGYVIDSDTISFDGNNYYPVKFSHSLQSGEYFDLYDMSSYNITGNVINFDPGTKNNNLSYELIRNYVNLKSSMNLKQLLSSYYLVTNDLTSYYYSELERVYYSKTIFEYRSLQPFNYIYRVGTGLWQDGIYNDIHGITLTYDVYIDDNSTVNNLIHSLYIRLYDAYGNQLYSSSGFGNYNSSIGIALNNPIELEAINSYNNGYRDGYIKGDNDGQDIGYFHGYEIAKDEYGIYIEGEGQIPTIEWGSRMYDFGHDIGFAEGDTYGYNRGLTQNTSNNFFELITNAIFGTVGTLFGITLFGNFTLGTFAIIGLIFGVLSWYLGTRKKD